MIDPAIRPATPSFAPESRASIETAPGRLLASSIEIGWTSVLLGLTDKSAPVGGTVGYESLATPDHAITLLVVGGFEFESFDRGVWRRVVRGPGSAGLTPGGHVNRMRCRSSGPAPLHIAHVFLPAALLTEAREEFRRAGSPTLASPLPSFGFRDPAVSQAVVTLLSAQRAGAPDLYAESVAGFLAAHLLAPHAGWRSGVDDRRSPGLLTDRRLARALEYLSAHFCEPVSLDRLALEACVSKFHFVRLFRAATGQAPHTYLVRLRLEYAQRLLLETDLAVGEVAVACGFTSAAHFGRAFARETGEAPTTYRTLRGLRPARSYAGLPDR